MLNLTPHPISVVFGEHVVTFPKSDAVARVSTTEKVVNVVVEGLAGVPVVVTQYGEVENVPAAGTVQFLVSMMVLEELGSEYHGWAFAPDTGPTANRNEKGHVVSVVKLKTAKP